MKLGVQKSGEFTPITAFIDHEYVEEVETFVQNFLKDNPERLPFFHVEVTASSGKTKIQFWNIGIQEGEEIISNVIDLLSRIVLLTGNRSLFLYDGEKRNSLISVEHEEFEE